MSEYKIETNFIFYLHIQPRTRFNVLCSCRQTKRSTHSGGRVTVKTREYAMIAAETNVHQSSTRVDVSKLLVYLQPYGL